MATNAHAAARSSAVGRVGAGQRCAGYSLACIAWDEWWWADSAAGLVMVSIVGEAIQALKGDPCCD
jgi:hypothetical protein